MYVTCATINYGGLNMKENKTISMSIRVNGEELEKIRLAARLSSYASYSEFVRRTALVEASKVIDEQDYSPSKGKGELK